MKMQSPIECMEWAEVLRSDNLWKDLQDFSNKYPHLVSPETSDIITSLLDKNKLICPQCHANESFIRLDLINAQNICSNCGNSFSCSDQDVLQHPQISAQIEKRPWEESCCKIERTVTKQYHPTDNFVRFLTSRIKGWSFRCKKEEEELIIARLREMTDPNLRVFRSLMSELGLRKFWQKFPQFMALAFPGKKHDILTEFDSSHLRLLESKHRKYVYAFKSISNLLEAKCFPNRPFTAVFFMFQDKDMWKYIKYIKLPKLLETAILNHWRLRAIEYKMVQLKVMDKEEMSKPFPFPLFYNSVTRKIKKEMPTIEQLEIYYNYS